MNRVQTNRVSMFKTVTAYLDQTNPTWNTMAPLATAVQQFKATVNAIDASAQKQEAPSGATEDKAAARDDLEDAAFLMCEALGALAHAESNNNLLALTNVSASDLAKLTDEELSNRVNSVLVEANIRKPALATLQVTQDNIDELDEALQAFNATKTAPRSATAARAVQTESLPVLIRNANEMLRSQIDRLVNLFRRTNPEFVAGYRAARVIVDRVATHSSRKPAAPPPSPQ